MEDILAIVFIFGGGSLFLLAISPVGRAIADRIRGVTPEGTPREMDARLHAVLDEVEQVRAELIDVQERLDFLERVLARQREAGQLPPGDHAGHS
jgi:hypothetical protein